jgi:ketosteroid isomerase-like protein
MSNDVNIQLLQESLEALSARDTDRFMAAIHEEVTWSLDASNLKTLPHEIQPTSQKYGSWCLP